jgi:hypothetical protein
VSTRANEPSRSRPDGAGHSPVLWFALLERARLTSDKALERRARKALARSGIVVTYGTVRDPDAGFPLTQAELQQVAIQVAHLLRGTTS